ncbi:MAG: hypothetical protein AABN33_15780 [Acidobacteriota bacterium]
MGRAAGPLAVPAPVRHLLREQVVGDRVEPIVVILEIRKKGSTIPVIQVSLCPFDP